MPTSKLYNKLPISPRPLVEVRMNPSGSPSATIDDDSIMSLTIHRGDATPDGGLHPSTAEVKSARFIQSLTSHPLTITIPNRAADAIAALTGQTRAAIQTRFTGRIANYVTEDVGLSRNETSVQAQSWSAVLNRTPYEYSFTAGSGVAEVLRSVLNRPTLPFGPTASIRGAIDSYGYIYDAIENARFSDVIDKFSTDLDILIREKHNGNVEIWSLVDRIEYTTARVDSLLPILRSHGLAPTSWEQPFYDLQANYRVLTREYPSGEYQSLTWNTGPESWRPEELVDLRQVQWRDNTQWHLLGAARRARTYTGSYRLPNLEIDLLRLLSGNSYSRRVAGQLLALEPGDPVGLANDWPGSLPGVHFAQGIDETITPTEWRITLSLVPWWVMFGEDSPMPRGRTWNSAFGRWRDYPNSKWKEA